jgi:hypothetical protein
MNNHLLVGLSAASSVADDFGCWNCIQKTHQCLTCTKPPEFQKRVDNLAELEEHFGDIAVQLISGGSPLHSHF